MARNGANGCGRSAAGESKGAGLCGLARAASWPGLTFNRAKSKKVLSYLKKQLERKSSSGASLQRHSSPSVNLGEDR